MPSEEPECSQEECERWRNHAQELVLTFIRFWEGTGDGVVLAENPPWPEYYAIIARHMCAFHFGWNAVDEDEGFNV